jgi:hypothetical protein
LDRLIIIHDDDIYLFIRHALTVNVGNVIEAAGSREAFKVARREFYFTQAKVQAIRCSAINTRDFLVDLGDALEEG